MKKGFDGIYALYIKRFLDIMCASTALIVFGWLYILIAILVRINLGSPVVFKQERPGLIDPNSGKEKIFKLYKFRSMTEKKDLEGNYLPDNERLTKFGRLLRASSLDELPEAFNILKGDMSVVGPRPLLTKYLEYYGQFEHKRHYVRPGLSGLAQVNGRNGATWKDRFTMDAEYVDNVGLALDIKIILKTVKNMITHEGIEYTQHTQTIVEYFASRETEKI